MIPKYQFNSIMQGLYSDETIHLFIRSRNTLLVQQNFLKNWNEPPEFFWILT